MVLIETSAGVGYRVTVAEEVKRDILGTDCTLKIHTVMRNDGIELFGFNDEESYAIFILLLSITGVGPKKAIAILETVPPVTLRQAVQAEDPDMLVSCGVNKKQAQRITVELQKKLTFEGEIPVASEEVVATLVALGYTKKEIKEVVKELQGKDMTTQEQIKEGLRLLQKPVGK